MAKWVKVTRPGGSVVLDNVAAHGGKEIGSAKEGMELWADHEHQGYYQIVDPSPWPGSITAGFIEVAHVTEIVLAPPGTAIPASGRTKRYLITVEEVD